MAATVRRDARRLGDHHDVHLADAPSRGLDVADGENEHLDRVAPALAGSVSGTASRCRRARRAEHGVGHGVRDRVAVGVAAQMHVRGDLDRRPARAARPVRSGAES
jgi:hypothetical protein